MFLGFFSAAVSLGALSARADSWSQFTSEETQPLTCRLGTFVTGLRCTGRYCDNVALRCSDQRLPIEIHDRFWSENISEESGRNKVGHRIESEEFGFVIGVISGIACSGSYCDNVSVEFTVLHNAEFKNCFWTSWVSEESGGTWELDPGRYPAAVYPAAVQCRGSYCDDKRFELCQISRR